MLSHSGGEQGFVGDKRGTFWSLDRHYDFAARSAVIAAIEEGRPPGVGLVGLLRRRARSSVKKRVGDSAPVLVIRGGGGRGDDHRGAEHGGRCARGKKSLGDHSSTPPSQKGRGCPDYQCNSSTLQFGGYSKPTLLTLSSVRRQREARRERAECDGRPGPVRPNTAGQGSQYTKWPPRSKATRPACPATTSTTSRACPNAQEGARTVAGHDAVSTSRAAGSTRTAVVAAGPAASPPRSPGVRTGSDRAGPRPA
jgi:hypothetical protein